MTEDRTTVEVNAPTVDEAISKGISELGVSEDAVQKEILDAGSRGIFGIGSRQARVRLTVVRSTQAAVQNVPPALEKITPPERVVEAVQTPRETQASVPAQVKVQAPVQPKPRPVSQAAPKVDAVQAFAMEENEDLKKAAGTVRDLIERMQVTASVTARFVDTPENKSGDKKDEQTILVEIHGNDLSIPKGQRKSFRLQLSRYGQ